MKPKIKLTKDELKVIKRIEKLAKLLYNLDLNLKDNVERVNGQLCVVSKAVPPKAQIS